LKGSEKYANTETIERRDEEEESEADAVKVEDLKDDLENVLDEEPPENESKIQDSLVSKNRKPAGSNLTKLHGLKGNERKAQSILQPNST
jgi:hypothetical protein